MAGLLQPLVSSLSPWGVAILLAAVAAYLSHGIDRSAGILMGLACLFLVYDAAWLRALDGLNPDHADPSGRRG